MVLISTAFSFTTDDTCDSMDSVNEGFGEAFSTADEAADAFGTNFDVNVQYQVTLHIYSDVTSMG